MEHERNGTHCFGYLRFCFLGKLVVIFAGRGAVGWKAASCACCHHGEGIIGEE